MALQAVACSTYRAGYDYVPRPLDVAFTEQTRVLLTVPGVRRAEKGVRSDAVEVVLQVDHAGPGTWVLRPEGLTLTGGNLVAFEAAETEPAEGLQLASGESGKLVAYFVIPGRDGAARADLEGLNLRMTADIDGKQVTQSATFMQRQHHRDGGGFRFGVHVGM